MPNLHPLNHINNADPKLINFINQVNQDIDKINGLIKEYNNTTSDKESIEKLKTIPRYKQIVESMALIQDLVKYDPKNRISLNDATNRLNNLVQEKNTVKIN